MLQRPTQAVAARASLPGRALTLPGARVYDVVVVLTQAFVFVPVALVRFVDGDEGTYAAAAKLVARGELPYLDFIYGQTPLLPFVYGLPTVLLGESWYVVRVLTAVFAIATGGLLYAHLVNRGRAFATAALVAYASSIFALAWFTPFKTYALSTLLLFAAFYLAERGRWLAAGIALGLAIDTRLLFAVAVLAFAFYAWRARRVAPFGAGLLLGVIPTLAFLAADPGRFWFDNVAAYEYRSSGGLVGDLRQKLEVAANLLGIGTPDGGVPQYALLLAAAAAGAAIFVVTQRRLQLAIAVAVLLAIASAAPTPTYTQYFAATTPFLLAAVFESAALVASGAARRPAPIALGATVLAVYVLLGAAALRGYVVEHRSETIGPIRDVAAIVDRRTSPDERVVASWPGYLFGTHAVPVEGLETDFGPLVTPYLSAAQARRQGRPTTAQIERMIQRGATRLVVVKRWHLLTPQVRWDQALRIGGYELVAQVHGGSNVETAGTIKIYERAP